MIKSVDKKRVMFTAGFVHKDDAAYIRKMVDASQRPAAKWLNLIHHVTFRFRPETIEEIEEVLELRDLAFNPQVLHWNTFEGISALSGSLSATNHRNPNALVASGTPHITLGTSEMVPAKMSGPLIRGEEHPLIPLTHSDSLDLDFSPLSDPIPLRAGWSDGRNVRFDHPFHG